MYYYISIVIVNKITKTDFCVFQCVINFHIRRLSSQRSWLSRGFDPRRLFHTDVGDENFCFCNVFNTLVTGYSSNERPLLDTKLVVLLSTFFVRTVHNKSSWVDFLALVVRFITRRFIGDYDPDLEKIYTYQTVIDNETVYFEILDSAGEPHVSKNYIFFLTKQ